MLYERGPPGHFLVISQLAKAIVLAAGLGMAHGADFDDRLLRDWGGLRTSLAADGRLTRPAAPASKIAHYAMDNDLTLKAAALKLGFVTEAEFDRVDPKKMVRPYVASGPTASGTA